MGERGQEKMHSSPNFPLPLIYHAIPWSSPDSFSSSPVPLKPGRGSVSSFLEAALKVHTTSQRCHVAWASVLPLWASRPAT